MANTKWILDPAHSEITLEYVHMMISNVRGSFTKFDASIDGEDFTTASVRAKIDANSLTTMWMTGTRIYGVKIFLK